MVLYSLMGLLFVLSLFLAWRIESLRGTNREIVDQLRRIAEGQRLSMVLSIGPSSLTIDPAEFEPKRDAVRERLLKAFETEKHPNPDTRAYCILDHSGWGTFVDGKTFQSAQTALGRLLTNNDIEAARKFVAALADQL